MHFRIRGNNTGSESREMPDDMPTKGGDENADSGSS
jgi:hypothetical protein